MNDGRFASLERLVGSDAVAKLSAAHVCVVGVGGVGSWTVESLARSGVGALTMIDMDDVCVTNINRQIHATFETVGQPKVDVLERRVRAINPDCRVRSVYQFLTPGNADNLLVVGLDAVVDATDRMSVKAAILGEAKKLGIPAVTIGSAGGKSDPLQIRCVDLSQVGRDELLRQVRRKLRKDYAWPKGEGTPMGVRAVVSSEAQKYPWPDGSVRDVPPENAACGQRMDCAAGFGAAAHVTGVFGLIAAAEVVRQITRGSKEPCLKP